VSTLARSKRAARSECANARRNERRRSQEEWPASAHRCRIPISARADHHGRQIWLGDQPAPECLHQDAGLDRAAAKSAIGFIDRQRQPAELGEFFPDLGTEAERIAASAAAVIGVVSFGNERSTLSRSRRCSSLRVRSI